MQFHRMAYLGAILAGGLLLAACGEEPQQEVAQATADTGAPSQAQAAQAAAAEATKHMVSGVTNTSKPGAPVAMWFDIKARPSAGAPIAIDLAFVPQAPTEHLRATFIATDGLTVKPGTAPPEYRNVEAGGVYRHTLTVEPREDGAYYVSAIVLMETANGPEARTFSIPVMVGVPDVVTKPAPPTDASGQPIESMPST